MYRINIHCEVPSTELLDAIAKHVGHLEVAIDYVANGPAPARIHHPVVDAVVDAELEDRRMERRGRAWTKAQYAKMMARTSPKAIKAADCPSCGAVKGQPCRGPKGDDYGMTGHTHMRRRIAAGLVK